MTAGPHTVALSYTPPSDPAGAVVFDPGEIRTALKLIQLRDMVARPRPFPSAWSLRGPR